MESALDILKGIEFGVVVGHFAGHLFGESPGRDLVEELETATEKAARRAQAEVARTDASRVESELRTGRARAVHDPDLAADGNQMEVDVVSVTQPHDGDIGRLADRGSYLAHAHRAVTESAPGALRRLPPRVGPLRFPPRISSTASPAR